MAASQRQFEPVLASFAPVAAQFEPVFASFSQFWPGSGIALGTQAFDLTGLGFPK
ncbi:hypothetical protein [Desertibaculum subflavum]|uniref:hypothetical protein n=1 Tax=Desertibaculum subflavum TaxID=2268458 RepID=UPI0013C43930